MKKTRASIAIVLVLAVGVGTTVFLATSRKDDVGDFQLSDYQWAIDSFPYDRNVGSVETSAVAIEKAKELWMERFGEINGKPNNPINGRKIEVSYNAESECWHVNGTLPPRVFGGVPHALIQKDGKVLAVWHDM